MFKRHFIKHLCLALLLLSFFVALHATPGWSDEFNTEQLAKEWMWDNPGNDSAYSLTDKPGWLSITVAKGEHNVWNQRGFAPMLVFKTAEKNYSIDAHLLTSGPFNQSTTGLIVIDKNGLGNPSFAGPWGALVLHSGDSVRWAQHLDGKPTELFNFKNVDPHNEACLKIVRAGDKWELLYESPIGKPHGWQSIGTTTLDIRGEHLVGFVVMNLGDAPSYTAHFDYVHTAPENLIGGALSVAPQDKLSTTWGKMKSTY
ncbi:hypothetical protein HYR99_28190 [Candidatus Poribacteria bacterium]|nr:hypothetical protein [Candidatus Poribacteria bacterium]